ncbi:acyl carrier protein [Heyndrickxia ginsengihumi]|uniref:Acyl carrier protein n=1 Tax=Heyndrickxia ginsengihumi TaxID=363870 RepID=A0A0A6VI85_9BACI|nr:acyl carrier protein [Heyndrickxia ginsengihumi]KHD86324.1 hypothetical protein NG54_04020 [Heyndrickxia ginsengihumi]NEY19398.1 acyl carrier protein [Heyndrickxia ginsengihumi]
MSYDQFVGLIAKVSNIPINDIQRDSLFKNDLGIDSLQMVNLLIELSNHLGAPLDNIKSNEDLATVGSLYSIFSKE